MTTSCKKPVFVSVYVVKPRRKDGAAAAASGGLQRRHHHLHHHYVHHVHHRAGAGYDRKAQLLSYAQQLRAAARRGIASPRRALASRGASPRRGSSPRRGVSPARKSNARSSSQRIIVPLRRNLSNGKRTPMGKTLLPSKSFQAKRKRNNAMRKLHACVGKKMDAMMRALGMKKPGFMKRLLTIFGKRR